MIKKITLVLSIGLILFSCKEKEAKAEEELLDKKAATVLKNEVNVSLLEQKSFKKEWVSNGKLIAVQKNALKFEVSDRLEALEVSNGDWVQKGQQLAVLRSYDFQQNLEKAQSGLLKTTLDFKDQLLGRGYSFENKENIPQNIYDMVAIRTGYTDAQRQVSAAEHDLNSIKLIAPFSGRVANINSKQYEYINAGTEFLTLINDTVFEVAFYLIESEIKEVRVNDVVEILPFALDQKYKGKITSINPMVEKNGTILVKAAVKNDGKLIEGMNVKVLIQKDIPKQFVVPKEAVVLRQNQEVLFKVINGKAYWTYVLTTNENSRNYSVVPHPDKSSAKLTVGDSIIVAGNLNLAHDSEVFVKENNN